MRRTLRALLAFCLLAACMAPAAWSRESDYYTNSDGQQVHRPEQAKRHPEGATARCRDGEYSFSQHHRGTCSGHGGVAEWYQ